MRGADDQRGAVEAMEATDLLLVNTLNEAANRGDSLEAIIHRLAELTREAFQCHGATVYLYSEDQGGARLVAQNMVLAPKAVQGVEALLGRRLPRPSVSLDRAATYRRVLAGDRPLILDEPEAINAVAREFTDNEAWQRMVPSIMRLLAVRSVILAPLVAAGRPVGLIDAARPHPFTERDARRFEVISQQMTGIIQRRQIEEALATSVREKTLVLDSISEVVIYQDLERRVIWANQAAERATGQPRDRMSGGLCHELWQGEEPCASCPVAEVVETGQARERELAMPSGHTWQVRFYPVRGAAGAVEGVIEVARDVTEQKRAAGALRESEERYRQLVEASPDPIAVVQDDVIKFANRRFRERLGYTAQDLAAGPRFSTMVRRREGAPDAPHRVDLITGDGRAVATEISRAETRHQGQPADLLVIRDITDRLRAEAERELLAQQLQRRQKLESIGVLAGGIAHDFNNLLTGVLGHADLVLQTLPQQSPVRASIQLIEEAGRRLSELTAQLLAYSGRGKMLVTTTDLSQLVREMDQVLRLSLAGRAALALELAPELPSVEADRAQLQQVVTHLIANAAEAVESRGGGTVSLRTGTVEVSRHTRRELYLDDELAPGPYVFLEVSDTGSGMDRETTAKIFEPFFSTKFTGRGLGLAAVMGIVRGHRGAIRVESEPGRGTTFQVLLPAAAAAAPRPEGPRAEPEASRRGAILVVDDEQTVRTVAQRMLASRGFSVLSATDGDEALRIFRERQDDIRAVLLDLSMPRLDGQETLKRLRGLCPGVKVILMSGYSEREARGRIKEVQPDRFIQKPFDSRSLLAAVMGVLR